MLFVKLLPNLITILILFEFLLLFVTQTVATESTTRVKSSYEYDFSPIDKSESNAKTSTFTGRNDQNAINLYHEYKDSIYVDRYYNSSFALNIPLFAVTLPGQGRGVHSPTLTSSTFNIGSSIVLSGMILAGIALFAPLIFPESRRSFERAIDIKSLNELMSDQMDDFSEHVFGHKLRRDERKSIVKTLERQFSELSTNIIHSLHESIEDLPHFPAKRLEECIKWCVCDAHKSPQKYGYLGKLFRSIFPHKTSETLMTKVLENYQKPANHGRDANVSCGDKYDDCSISIVDIIQEFNILASNQFNKNAKSKDKSFIWKVLEYYFDI